VTNTEPRLIAGRYRLVTALATGGMGVVWQGWDERLERPVAIKQLRVQAGLSPAGATNARDRAMREARNTARLHHPHAVPVYDVVDQDGEPCLIMEFLPSVSLQEAVHSRGTLSPAQTARIGSEIAAALTAAHRVGIVHRDVKPGNVLLAEDGTAKLTDFGISHAVGDPTLTATGMVSGTPAYLAPEVARGKPASFASDVFSLGATLYTATEGGPPFGEDDNAMAVLHRVASGQLRPPRQSGALTALLMRMLNPDPQSRPSMTEVSHALATLHAEQDAPAALPQIVPTERIRLPDVPPFTPSATLTDADPVPVREPDRGDSSRRGDSSLRGVVAAVLAAVVVIAAVVIVVAVARRGSHADNGSPAKTPIAGGKSTARSTRPAPTSTTPTTPAAPTSRVPVAPTAAALAQAVVGYYRLIPDDLRAGYALLTPAYRNSHAGGFNEYRKFWRQFREVTVSNVSGQPPNSATATITYVRKNGTQTSEQTSFRFVRSGRRLLIDDSTVLGGE
jgi:eukaryotic-like serine/threonine-protein kinase